MTQEDKDLLLKDLCARLPYGVIIEGLEHPEIMSIRDLAIISVMPAESYKPYLRPLSSMTEKEFLEYHHIKYNSVTYRKKYERFEVGKFHNVGIIPIDEYLDWLNAHHFDYRGLIPMGLAIEAPKGMYNIN